MNRTDADVQAEYQSQALSAMSEKAKKDQIKNAKKSVNKALKPVPKEVGGRSDGLDPTRYGDWEKNGRCIDF